MSKKDIILKVEKVSKQYRLGLIGTGTISHDLNRWWYRIRGKDDPYLKIGDTNDRSSKAESEYVWALKNINFEVERGEVLGIIGKNGAGKSTLLKILSRVTGPTTGSIKSKGRIASLLEVGTGFHPELTGKENIYLNGAILGMTKSEINAKLNEIVEFSGCERYVDTPVKRYSSGMRVRLAFAVAAFLEPDILVVDEVLAVGDAEFQKKAIGKMKDISSSDGRTVLFVSHNMSAIENLCDRLIIIDKGGVKYEGNVEQGIVSYLNSEKSNSLLELSSRKDRINGNIFRFTSVEVFSGSIEKMYPPRTGKTLFIKLNYESKEKFDKVLVRIIISNNMGKTLFVCNNFHSSKAFDQISRNGYFLCTIPKLGLLSDNYLISLKCVSHKEIIDEVENATNFNVTEGDFFSTGKVPSINSVLVNHEINYFSVKN
ncbi:ABC transporter ATP-binding protein [Lutimonas zeaxanthinifaciens]|uniref:ABC transporter ATP-binding protein n=1 Tax=Lutimonas zeaxanthinifaciens TaxID=3060215 RepID=UPI00265CADDF|nr:ABC transporter ATP-binding protein [Lutimonas sp. YSD2104]WKK67344.1 ABC transporter ATP-binding protein [Lutimonas sp. YSD2104]